MSGYFLGDDGAGEGNRTLLRSLEGYCITTMLRPHSLSGSISSSHLQGNPPQSISEIFYLFMHSEHLGT